MEIAPFSSRFKLYDQLELLEFPNKFFIKPVDSHHQGFSVDRRDVNIKPLDGINLPSHISLYLFSVLINENSCSRKTISDRNLYFISRAVVFDVTIQLIYFARIASHFFFSDRSLSIASLTTPLTWSITDRFSFFVLFTGITVDFTFLIHRKTSSPFVPRQNLGLFAFFFWFCFWISRFEWVMEPLENCGGCGCDEATFKTVEKIYSTINQFFRMWGSRSVFASCHQPTFE